jgi:hypothetical protein
MSSIPAFALRFWERSTLRNLRLRAVLLACVVVGLLVPTYFFVMADAPRIAWDFRAYYTAAEAALNGEPFVGIDTGIPGVSYVYPPVAVTLFLPQAAAGGWKLAFVLQTVVNVAAALALAALVVRTVESRRGRLSVVDRILVVGFCVGSAPAMAILGQGQVDMLIALALASAFLALERGKQGIAGAVLAGASLVKVFPVALGLWLVWRRAWRAVGAALITGIAGLALGWLWFGLDAYRRYLDVLVDRSRIAEFACTVSPNFFAMSLYRPFSQLLPNVDPHLYAPLSLLAVTPVVALVANREREFAGRLTTYLVAITVTLLVSPASNVLYVTYVYFPLVCLLYLEGSRRRQSMLLVGTVAITFPVQPRQIGTVLSMLGVPDPIGSQVLFVVSELLTVASIPLLGLLAILAWATLRSVRPEEQSSVEVRPARAD